MKTTEKFKILIDELYRVHSDRFDWKAERGFPAFSTAKNGRQVHFPTVAQAAFLDLTKSLYKDTEFNNIKIEYLSFSEVVKTVIVDLFAENRFLDFYETGEKQVIKFVNNAIGEKLALLETSFTHHFPAWTARLEAHEPLQLGPVVLRNRFDWLDSVNFSEQAIQEYGESAGNNCRWKDEVRNALRQPKSQVELDGLALAIYSPISECPAVVSVMIPGYERNFSRKLAKIVCKTALDCLSLALGQSRFFHQQALYEERLPPLSVDSIIESNGYLWMPGMSLGDRLPIISGTLLKQTRKDIESLLPAFSFVLENLVRPSENLYPKLSNRWSTALDWLSEGNRELTDSIALAKIGTSLDILSCGGKANGISKMISNLTKTDEQKVVVPGDKPLTLKELVCEIYSNGRSKILHGTHFDRLQSFSHMRQQAAFLTRITLIESAMQLAKYTGSDDDEKAFCKMLPSE